MRPDWSLVFAHSAVSLNGSSGGVARCGVRALPLRGVDEPAIGSEGQSPDGYGLAGPARANDGLVGEFDALLDHQCACALERKAVGALMVFGRSLDSGEFPARRELFAIRRKAEFEGRARVDAQPGPCVKLDFRRTRGRPRTGTRDSWRAGRGRRQRTGCSRDPKNPRDAHTRMLRRPMPDAVRERHHSDAELVLLDDRRSRDGAPARGWPTRAVGRCSLGLANVP
jgi:hypothetical protein